MSSPEHPYGIASYLNPNYWGDQTLGYGVVHYAPSVRPPRSAERYARKVLETRIRSDSVVPLHTFRTGDVFDPADYEPGTIVIYREDMLSGQPAVPDYSLAKLAAQELPPRLTETSPSFSNTALYIHANDKKREYFSRMFWGVVPRDTDGSYISAISALGVARLGTGVRVMQKMLSRNAPITIGETSHREQTRTAPERLLRVNIMHIVAYGASEKQRSKVFGFVARTALG